VTYSRNSRSLSGQRTRRAERPLARRVRWSGRYRLPCSIASHHRRYGSQWLTPCVRISTASRAIAPQLATGSDPAVAGDTSPDVGMLLVVLHSVAYPLAGLLIWWPFSTADGGGHRCLTYPTVIPRRAGWPTSSVPNVHQLATTASTRLHINPEPTRTPNVCLTANHCADGRVPCAEGSPDRGQSLRRLAIRTCTAPILLKVCQAPHDPRGMPDDPWKAVSARRRPPGSPPAGHAD
jgi:hypothetical protein